MKVLRCGRMVASTVLAFGILVWAPLVYGGQAGVTQKEPSNSGKESEKMSETIIHADLLLENFQGPQVELYVNYIPVARAGGKLQPWASVPVPEFLVDGTNRLTVIIGIGETPSTASKGQPKWKCDSSMAIHARIVQMKDGEPARPGSGKTLLDIRWDGEREDPFPFPIVLSSSKDLGEQFGAWQWESADVLTPDSATHESAVKFISEINAAYTAGNPDPILRVAKFKHAEAGRAYPMYGEGITDEMFREQLAMVSKEPNWKPYALPLDQYDLRLVAEGRLIEAIAKDWRPILRMEDGDYAFPMFIGKVKGEWQILR